MDMVDMAWVKPYFFGNNDAASPADGVYEGLVCRILFQTLLHLYFKPLVENIQMLFNRIGIITRIVQTQNFVLP